MADLIPDPEKTTIDQGVASSDEEGDSSSHRRISFAVAFVFLDDMIIRIFKFLKSRKNMGRTIFGVLIFMVAVSMFVKFSLMLSNSRYNLEIISGNGRSLNKYFILNTLAKPSHHTQLMMAAQRDHQEGLSSTPKRVLPVSFPVFFKLNFLSLI